MKFFKDRYVLKLDLRRPEAAFFSDNAAGKGVREALRKETVFRKLPFLLNAQGNLPAMAATVGSVQMPLVLDTGSSEVLWADAETETRLEKDGVLRKGADDRYSLGPIAVDGVTLPAVDGVRVERGRCPFGKQVGAENGTVLGLGLDFLTLYRSLWDYQRQLLYLLRD